MCEKCVEVAHVMNGFGFPVEVIRELVPNAFKKEETMEQPVAPDNSEYLRRIECLKLAMSSGTITSQTSTGDIIRRGAAFYNYATRGEKVSND